MSDTAAPDQPDHRLPVFVYGTLRPGGRLHHHVAAVATRIRPADLPGHVLHGGPTHPWVAPGAGLVRGDLVAIAADRYHRALADLDRVEMVVPGAGDNEYERVAARVEPDVGAAVTAWVWRAGPGAPLGPVIASGDWFDRDATDTT